MEAPFETTVWLQGFVNVAVETLPADEPFLRNISVDHLGECCVVKEDERHWLYTCF